MRKTIKSNKKAQEEIFGFLIIVALVMVVGILFLLLQKPKESKLENDQISNLVWSMTSYTSSYQNREMSEVIEECYECGVEDCEQCVIAEQEMEEMLDIAFEEGGFVVGSQLNGALLNVSNSEELFSIKKGETSGNMIGYPRIIHTSGEDVVVTLKVYY